MDNQGVEPDGFFSKLGVRSDTELYMVLFVTTIIILVIGLVIALSVRLCRREKESEDVSQNTD